MYTGRVRFYDGYLKKKERKGAAQTSFMSVMTWVIFQYHTASGESFAHVKNVPMFASEI